MSNARPESYDREVAHHEAGHFVAHWVLNDGDVSSCTIAIDPGDGYEGVMRGGLDAPDGADRSWYEDKAVEMYAGYEAQVQYDPDSADRAATGASHDDARAAHVLVLGGIDPDEMEGRLRARARQLIRDRWGLVEALASTLLDVRSMDSFDAAELLEGLARSD